MKRYIKANYSRYQPDSFDYKLFRPLIKACADDYYKFIDQTGDGFNYATAVDFVAQHMQTYLEDMTYEEFEDMSKLYFDLNL